MRDSDFDFYDDDELEENAECEGYKSDIAGITDEVTSYTYTNLSYPCIVFADGFSCPKHQMKVISNMVKSGGEDRDTTLYFANKNELYKLGNMSGRQVESLLDMVGTENIVGYYVDGTRITGDRMYTLCVI